MGSMGPGVMEPAQDIADCVNIQVKSKQGKSSKLESQGFHINDTLSVLFLK